VQQQQHSTLHSFMCHSARCFAVCLHGGGAQIPTALLHRAVLPFSGTLQPPPDPHRQLIARKIAQKYEIYVKFAPRGLENKFRGKNKICSALLNEIVVWKSGCVSHCTSQEAWFKMVDLCGSSATRAQRMSTGPRATCKNPIRFLIFAKSLSKCVFSAPQGPLEVAGHPKS
jgi:hypothetical protein